MPLLAHDGEGFVTMALPFAGEGGSVLLIAFASVEAGWRVDLSAGCLL